MTASPEHAPEQCARAWHVLRIAHRAIEDRLEHALRTSCELSLHEFDALLVLHLGEPDGCRMQEFMGPVPLSQPALSRLIDRLGDRDLVERAPATDDGRATVVRLTDKGKALAAHAMEVHSGTIESELTAHLSSNDQRMLLDILIRLAPDS